MRYPVFSINATPATNCKWTHGLKLASYNQGRHGEFELGKVQYSTPNFFDRLFLIRAYFKPKSRQGPNLACLPCRGGPNNRWSPIIVRGLHQSHLVVGKCPFAQISFFLPTKALTKQEGPNICLDARLWHVFFWILISCLLQKKRHVKNQHPSKRLVLFLLK